MALRFDEKGKYFTDYVTKESVPVVIQTYTHHIRGYVYVQEDGRLSDELNATEQFLPVTQAVILDLSGNKMFETNFLAVNRSQIIWVYPEDVPPAEEAYAVDELLMGQDPIVSDEVFVVGNPLAEAESTLVVEPELAVEADNPLPEDVSEPIEEPPQEEISSEDEREERA